MIKNMNQDILTAKQGVIVQQVNCQGVMGAGLAKQIRQAYPEVYKAYLKACALYKPEELLGKIQFIKVTDKLTVCNFFAQLNYGTSKVHTDYTAFKKCLYKLASKTEFEEPIYIPYKIGCGLAGGDWEIIKVLLEDYLYNHNVTICRKEVK